MLINTDHIILDWIFKLIGEDTDYAKFIHLSFQRFDLILGHCDIDIIDWSLKDFQIINSDIGLHAS